MVGLFTFFLLSTLMAQTPTIEYTLRMSKPWTHVFEVEASFKGLPANEAALDLILPAWRSGRYIIFDLAGYVLEFTAVDSNNKPLKWQKIDKSTWRIEKKGVNTVTARYTVFGNDFNRIKNGVNDEHAFVNGAAVFMYSERYRKVPVVLTVAPYDDWHVTTGLEPVKGNPNQLTARHYDHLLDCPLMVGNQKDFEFHVDGTPHVLSIFGGGNWKADTLTRDIGKIVKAEKDFWGEFPYKRYVFMLMLSPIMGGGTEYLNSTIMGAKPFVFNNSTTYQDFLGLVAHEFFHTWNVKQLRPKDIHPYDYTKENYTKELWIAEGTTSYYSSLIRARAGLTTKRHYLDSVANSVREDRQRPGNKVQSLSESSFDAWIKYWKPGEQDYNYESDYYGKGSDVSLVLDLEIRQRTKNKYSLDDVMRAMYRRFPLDDSGYTINDFQKVAEEMTGGSLKEFFQDYVHGTKPFEWEQVLGYAGLELVPQTKDVRPWLGISTQDTGEKTRVTRVVAGGPGEEAGLNVGDEILALNGYRVRAADLQARVSEMSEGGRVTITVFRDDMHREFQVTVRKPPVPSYKILKVKDPTDLQKSIYESWLRISWE